MSIELTPYQLRIKEIAVEWAEYYEIKHSDSFLYLIDEEIDMYYSIIESYPLNIKTEFLMLEQTEKQKHIIYYYLVMIDEFIKYKEFLYNYPFEL